MVKTKLEILILIVATLVPRGCLDADPVEWHMINVNYHTQGDAHLINDGSKVVLVDAGEKATAELGLIPYLRTLDVRRVHHFIISHPHTDHYGGLEALLESEIRVEHIYFNLPPDGMDDWNYKRQSFLHILDRAKLTGSKLHNIGAGYSISLPNSLFKVLYAHKQPTLGDGSKASINAFSLILQWNVGDFKVLFTGDLDEPLGRELAHLTHLEADILKVPHHGATSVAPLEFFDRVAPSLNMFPSTSALWIHPRVASVRSWTHKAGIYFCNNGLNGNVTLDILGSNLVSRSDRATTDCPDGLLSITPKRKLLRPAQRT